MPAVPADAGTLTSFPADHPVADRVNDAGYFMSRDPRVLDTRPHSLLGQGIAVADAASLDLYPHLSRAGLRDLSFNEFEGATGTSDLHDAHLRHSFSNRISSLRRKMSDTL